MDSESEDVDAKDEGATTLCGLPAAMDSALAPTATSLTKLRSHPNPKNGPGARTQRATRHVHMDSESEDIDANKNVITINFEAHQDSTNIHLEDFHHWKPANSALSFGTRFIWS